MQLRLFTLANGKEVSVMDMGQCNGLMVLSTKVIGRMVRHVVKANFSIQMETLMRDSGTAIRPMATESIKIIKEQDMKASGKTISNMVMAQKHGTKALGMKVTMPLERRKAKESISGLMDLNMSVIGVTTR